MFSTVSPLMWRTLPHVVVGFAFCVITLPSAVSAQGFAGGFVADPAALDTLNSGGGGFNSQTALNNANAAAGGFGGAPADPFAVSGDPFGAAPGAGFPGAPGGGFPGGGFPGGPAQPFSGFGAPAQPIQPQAAPIIPSVKGIFGDRVICPVTGQMLEDASEVSFLNTFVNEYSDDGKTLLDFKPGDGTYTNARLVENFMSPEAMLVKTRALRNLEILEAYKPYEFASVLVASTDPLRNVPNMQDLEELRDSKLELWANDFLTRFRVDPTKATEENSIFYQSFMPDPPRTPRAQLPPAFIPPRNAAQARPTEGGAGGPGLEGAATNAIGSAVGTNNIQTSEGASSKYF
ncbi:MAG: hypothetical protein SFY68_08470 [Candidatus Sumerlaeia bacterium]|nr:hypothetical protein [Candidatus Sumerlaeia bacterium]